MKTLIPFLFTLVLTACGGGGGGGETSSSASNAVSYKTVSNYDGFVPSLNTGHFTNDGATHIIATGWLSSSSNNSTKIAPVKIFKAESSGLTDVTTQILGETVSWSVQYSIVADFNNDGIDDIFLPGFMDVTPYSYQSVFYISRSGQSHAKTEYSTATYNHGATAGDVDNDGDIDIVSSSGHMWINDGAGNFSFKSAGTGMNGNGVCIADFNNTGKSQVLITDIYTDAQFSPISDSIIFELDSNLNPTQTYTLPVPYFDRGNLGLTSTIFGVEFSHDVSCAVSDVNSDGLLDIVIISGYNGGGKQSKMQLYLNQGNFVFTDATDSNIINYNTSIHSSYIPKFIDFNGDGHKDIWLMHFDWENINPNQLWLNNGSGTFNQSNIIASIISTFGQETSADSNYIGPAMPIKINNVWYLIVSSKTNGVLNLAIKTFS